MELSPYLNFNGNCSEAFKFYENTLGGKIETLMTHGDSPMKDQVSADWRDKVMHVRLVVGNFALMGSDAPPQMFAPAQGSSVSLTVDNFAEGERIFAALSAGGKTPALPKDILVTGLRHDDGSFRHAVDGEHDPAGMTPLRRAERR